MLVMFPVQSEPWLSQFQRALQLRLDVLGLVRGDLEAVSPWVEKMQRVDTIGRNHQWAVWILGPIFVVTDNRQSQNPLVPSSCLVSVRYKKLYVVQLIDSE